MTGLLAAAILGPPAYAQEIPTAATPAPDPELQRLENENRRLELELDNEKKRNALLRERLPQSDTAPLPGTITADKEFTLPSQIMAYRALDAIAAQARVDLLRASGGAKTLVVFSEEDFLSVASYHSTLAQIRVLKGRYDEVLENVPAPIAVLGFLPTLPTVASALLQSTAGVTAFFRSDVAIQATDVSMRQEAVIAALANALSEDSAVTVVYPPLYFPRQLFQDRSGHSKLLQALDSLSVMRMRSAEVIAEERLKQKIPRLKALNEEFDKLMVRLSTPDEKTGVSILATLLRGELLHATLAEESTRILVVEIMAAGGASKTTRNLFTGARLFHTGGTVISLILLEPDGTIGFARNYWAATAFESFDDPNKWEIISSYPR